MKQQGTGDKTQEQAESWLAWEDAGSSLGRPNEIECRAGVEGKAGQGKQEKTQKLIAALGWGRIKSWTSSMIHKNLQYNHLILLIYKPS